jgi:hypothetical protein
MKTIVLLISPDGTQVRTEVKGVKGSSCEDLTKNLLRAFGEITESGKTPEYYMEEVGVIHEKN